MSAAITAYRAKVDCRVGGFFRRKGEEFGLPPFGDGSCPVFLEVVPADGAENTSAPEEATSAAIPKKARTGKAENGAGAHVPAADVTSAGMVTK